MIGANETQRQFLILHYKEFSNVEKHDEEEELKEREKPV